MLPEGLSPAEHLRRIVASLDDVLAVLDEGGRILAVNEVCERVMGYRTDEMAGRRMCDFVVPADLAGLQDALRQAAAGTGGQVASAMGVRCKDGRERKMMGALRAFPEDDGHLVHYLLLRDVTELVALRQDLEGSEARFRTLFEASADGILVADADTMRIVMANRRMEELLGRPAAGLLSLGIPDILPPDFRERAGRLFRDGIRDDAQPFQRDIPVLRADGSVLVCDLGARRMTLSGRACLVGLFTDATDRVARERELERLKEEAESASRVKSLFLANMSHELRTPLNGMLGMAQILGGGRLDDDQRESLDLIRRCGESLLSLINDILEFSHGEDGGLQVRQEVFSTRGLLDGIRGLFQPQAAAKHLDFRCEAEPAVPARLTGDALRLRQVLTHLVGNAVKFTERGSVSLRLSGRPEGADGFVLEIEVADTGIGMPEEFQPVAFRPFAQADPSTSRAHGGAGLGLSIVGRIVARLNGRLAFSSRPGAGSTFSVAVPLRTPPGVAGGTDAAARAAPAPAGPLPVEVLVVDDDPVSRKVAAGLLRGLVEGVAVASGGREALEMLSRRDYGAVLLDIMMPGMDGMETLRLLREARRGGRMPPVIAMTAFVATEDRVRYLQAGMNDVVAKPVMRDGLHAVLERHLRAGA